MSNNNAVKGIVCVIFRGFVLRKQLDLGVKLPIGCERTLKSYLKKKRIAPPPSGSAPVIHFMFKNDLRIVNPTLVMMVYS